MASFVHIPLPQHLPPQAITNKCIKNTNENHHEEDYYEIKLHTIVRSLGLPLIPIQLQNLGAVHKLC